ncbi:uncharacterized protein PV09_08688 [Verruconis gallopava]|uniref:MIF4G domain-containing protein n=1 Tax=Verruconis gallopava TaxID=253628 RepID=A0A0D1ZYX0_9PEZI|nr:uncharacterized protein PV09_08688 [Verruconis gallopava]KIV99622.1 hypothetical protein PV09_08688 [Verruconis gallopava]
MPEGSTRSWHSATAEDINEEDGKAERLASLANKKTERSNIPQTCGGLALKSNRANSFSSRRILTSRSRAHRLPPRERHHIGHGIYDDPRHSFAYNSGVECFDGLEYDEKPACSPPSHPHQQCLNTNSNQGTGPHPSGTFNRGLFDRFQHERHTRPIRQYGEEEASPEHRIFEGYDSNLNQSQIEDIWKQLFEYRLPRSHPSNNDKGCLTSFYQQEFEIEHLFRVLKRLTAKEHRYDASSRELAFSSSQIPRRKVAFSESLQKQNPRQRNENPSFCGLIRSYTQPKHNRREGPAEQCCCLSNSAQELTELLSKLSIAKPELRLPTSQAFLYLPNLYCSVPDSRHPSLDNELSSVYDVNMDESSYNERRRDGGGRRGGRHSYGAGGGGRKRGREDDDDHRDYRRQQRPRYEEPVASRIRRDIIYIGEDSANGVQDQCAGFGRDIANNFDDDQVRGPLLDTLVDMLCEQPLKIPFLAAVALYANNLNADVGRELIARASKKMASALATSEWRDFKLLLRFHACLQGILEGVGVFQILNQIFDWVIDLQSASADDALGLELTKVILLTIPYVIVASPDSKAYLDDILDKTEIVASEAANHPLAELVDGFPAEFEDRPFGYQSVVEMLQKQLRGEANRNWEFKCIPRLYVPIKAVKTDCENGVAQDPTKHTLPAITIPAPVDATKRPLFPETHFTMFANQDIKTVPSMHDISLSLIRDAMTDTISILHYNRLAVANFLTKVDDFWTPGTFATRGITLDQLRNYPADRSTWKPEDMFIDAVFSQLMTLPEPKQKLIYYHSIIFEACKLAPSAVAPTLGRGIRWLFRHIDCMDLELLYRYLDWFAHHLSNFEFRWKWTEWVDELERSDITPKKAFIIAAIDKEVRLSFAKRIRDTLPEAYYPLLSEGKFKDVPPFKFDKDDTPFASEGREVFALMKRKASEEQIEPYIEAVREQAANFGLDPMIASIDVYMTALCHSGAKSVSHITAAIDRSRATLQNSRQRHPGVGRQIVQSVVAYWKDQPGNAVNIVDKLLNYTIVTPDSVIEWALGPESLGDGAVLAESWRYEIVAKTVGKVTGRVQQIVQAYISLEVQGSDDTTANVEDIRGQIGPMNQLLVSERNAMRQLFATIIDAVSGVATGAAEGLVDSATSEEYAELIKVWAQKWARVFRRKLAVVETRVSEAAVESQLVSAKEQYKLKKEREAREAEEEAAARAKDEAEHAEKIKREEEAKAGAEVAANGDAAIASVEMNGNGDAEDLDVAE